MRTRLALTFGSLLIALIPAWATQSAVHGRLSPGSPGIRQQIEATRTSDFSPLIKQWQGSANHQSLTSELLALSRDTTLADRSRYIAIQGTAALASTRGDRSTLAALGNLARDPSWLVRTGVLKAFESRDRDRARDIAQSLLRDPALVVRLEALNTLEKIQPRDPATLMSLVNAAEDPRNWQGEKPLWIPERAVTLAERLSTGRRPAGKLPLRTRISALRKELR
jgi:hypothetical protein